MFCRCRCECRRRRRRPEPFWWGRSRFEMFNGMGFGRRRGFDGFDDDFDDFDFF